MAEEVKNASTIVPWCMITTILLNGFLGFATVVVFCFCLGDLTTDLASPTGYDFIQVFYSATNSNAGTSVMTAILITLVICATFGFLATASRQTWAFARDQGLPFSNFLSYVRASLLIQVSLWSKVLRYRLTSAWLCLSIQSFSAPPSPPPSASSTLPPPSLSMPSSR
jgi:amino acid transporter